MQQRTFSLEGINKIHLRCHADLRLTGWDRTEASVEEIFGHECRAEEREGVLYLRCLDSSEMLIPAEVPVEIEKVSGDARIANLSGKLAIGKIGGDATLVEVAETVVGKVGGDLRIKDCRGSLTVEKVGGTLSSTGLEGNLTLDSAGGDVLVDGVVAIIARAGGDMRVRLSPGVESNSTLRAGGNLELSLPRDFSGRFNIHNGAEKIKMELQEKSERWKLRDHTFVLGSGEAQVNLWAGGWVRLTDQAIDTQPGAEQKFAGLEEKIVARMREKLIASEELSQRATRMADEAVRRAEERINEVMQRMETRRTGSQAARQEPVSAQPAEEYAGGDVSDEERLFILRMLQDKKISVEEADALMDALENGGIENS